MNKYFKNAILFITGLGVGFGICGGLIAKKVLTSEDWREFIIKKISKRITNFIYGDVTYENEDYHVKKFVSKDRNRAIEILNDLEQLIDTYGFAVVRDFYDLCDIIPVSYTDSIYGWTNLKGAAVIPVRGGYEIRLPMAIKLR